MPGFIIATAFLALWEAVSLYLVLSEIRREKEPIVYYDDGTPPKFFITGDKHRNFQKTKKICRDMRTRKKDVLIILGDSGLNYYEDERDDQLKKELEEWKKSSGKEGRKKVLVIHQQFAANAVRNELEKDHEGLLEVKTGTFFKFIPEYGRKEDLVFKGEDDLLEELEKGGYDLLVADGKFRKFLKRESKTKFIAFTHFAVSGKLEESI